MSKFEYKWRDKHLHDDYVSIPEELFDDFIKEITQAKLEERKRIIKIINKHLDCPITHHRIGKSNVSCFEWIIEKELQGGDDNG